MQPMSPPDLPIGPAVTAHNHGRGRHVESVDAVALQKDVRRLGVCHSKDIHADNERNPLPPRVACPRTPDAYPIFPLRRTIPHCARPARFVIARM